jgi:hypothetical protein
MPELVSSSPLRLIHKAISLQNRLYGCGNRLKGSFLLVEL